jgi:hypothetical protein
MRTACGSGTRPAPPPNIVLSSWQQASKSGPFRNKTTRGLRANAAVLEKKGFREAIEKV